MPVHDWTRVDAGLFHAFHQQWISNVPAPLEETNGTTWNVFPKALKGLLQGP